MSRENNIAIAKALLAAIEGGVAPEAIAEGLTEDMSFEIEGDRGRLSWIGTRAVRSAVANFIRDSRTLIRHSRFGVEECAVILGRLSTEVLATKPIINPAFVIVLTPASAKNRSVSNNRRQLRSFACGKTGQLREKTHRRLEG
ncbi:hypothetical protein AB4Z52_14800 [Rhizobium sp. 2YAF20]|uniref:hypothetical protein n=1 Tax=Rhizobium sp. 2YAF20 TaxID=3233027 RepID=UPI003F96065B